MVYNELRPALLFLTHALPIISALGINCRGSILCGRASLSNQQSVGIIQILRDVIWASPMSNSTTYASGDHDKYGRSLMPYSNMDVGLAAAFLFISWTKGAMILAMGS
ncbi:hypothetical protein HO173_002585 [Letharia columbiana]|uniref:Uncharacterized protein n=1 Tax=Letharia columbiana TaxID=112416 RepID=A0A8H6G2S1_9LECA|nr:uncharacterized protein HO173_002585 [Letharia columbiana]KAF6239323.1 hypothetical protein HO173_002585 [Letharia columbiana]